MRISAPGINAGGRMPAMRNRKSFAVRRDDSSRSEFRPPKHERLKENLKVPALCVGDEEIAENLDARDRFEFLRIDEIGVHRERVGLAE